MQHQLAISPLCQITRYTQILTLSLSFSSLLPFYPFFLSFAPFSLSPSLSLSRFLLSLSLLPSEKAFLRAPFCNKSTAHLRVTLKDVTLKSSEKQMVNHTNYFEIISSTWREEKMWHGQQAVHFAQFNVNSYRIRPFAGIKEETCNTMGVISKDSID